MLPDHISSDQPKNGVIVKIVIDIVRYSSNIISQYVKELGKPDRSLIHKVMCEVVNLQALRQHQRTVEDIGVEPMTLSLQS